MNGDPTNPVGHNLYHDLDNPQAWLREHATRLVLFARTWVDCHADAEDVLQEAFVRFWQRRHEAHHPRAYLYQCVKTAAMNWRRSASRRRRHEQSIDDDALLRASDGLQQSTSHSIDIGEALAALPAKQREVVVMKVWGGLTFAEISDVASIPQGTAQSRYRYALGTLRKILDSKVIR